MGQKGGLIAAGFLLSILEAYSLYLDIGENSFVDENDIVMILDKRQISAEMERSLLQEMNEKEKNKSMVGCKSVLFLTGGGILFSTNSPQTLLNRSKRAQKGVSNGKF